MIILLIVEISAFIEVILPDIIESFIIQILGISA